MSGTVQAPRISTDDARNLVRLLQEAGCWPAFSAAFGVQRVTELEAGQYQDAQRWIANHKSLVPSTPEHVSELAAYDDAFNPQSVPSRPPGLEALPGGSYDFEIEAAEFTRTLYSKELILRWLLRVLSGERAGLRVEHAYFFRRQQQVDVLGAHLCTLGFDADKWKPQAGRRFSDELPKAVPKMPGIRFHARKETESGSDGKTYHVLYLNARLSGVPMPGPREK